MTKLTERIKIILHPKFERKRIWGRYFMALWFFNKVVWLVLPAMLEGILLPSNMAAAKATFWLYKTFDSYAQMCVKRYHIIFSTFSLKFKCKICVKKTNKKTTNKKITFWSPTSYELTHFKKTMPVWKTKSLYYFV